MTEQREAERIQEYGKSFKRRGLIAGAAALIAGIAANRASQPVTANGATWTLPYSGSVSDPSTWAFTVANTGSGGIGIHGDGVETGVSGSGGRFGVYGVSGGSNSGLLAGQIGVGGQCLTSNGIGVYGYVSSGDGSKGVYGQNTSSGSGVYGVSTGGRGVYGESHGSDAVFGNLLTAANSGYAGVHGAGNGVGTFGVTGNGAGGTGVSGYTSGLGSYGVQGSSTLSHGVVGLSGNTAGASGVVAVGQSAGAVGFQGVAQGGALYAGYFYGDVSINKRASDGQGGNLGVAGAKFAIVKGQDGKYRGMYAVESPECWFEDFGTGKMVAGKASVTLDPLFAQHVHTDDYHVFITEHDQHNDLHVTGRTESGFAVQADEGTLRAKGKEAAAVNGTFSWRVVAKRNDIKDERMPIWDIPPGVGGVIAPVVVPPEPAQPVQANPPSRPNPPAVSPPQGSGGTQGGATNPVQPLPPPRP